MSTLFATEMETGAEFSPCRTYRYSLWRYWGHEAEIDRRKMLAVIGLNPSTADEINPDPTITRCINFAKDWGFDGLYMLNLFAYRATKPKDMRAQAEPIGPGNDEAIVQVCGKSLFVLAAWGTNGTYRNRAEQVERLIPKTTVYCLRLTQGGHPEHPLYIPAGTKPVVYRAAA